MLCKLEASVILSSSHTMLAVGGLSVVFFNCNVLMPSLHLNEIYRSWYELDEELLKSLKKCPCLSDMYGIITDFSCSKQIDRSEPEKY